MNNKAIKYTTKTENNNASQKRVFVFLTLCKQNRVRKRTMPKLTTEQRVFIVTHYYETGSVDEVKRSFEEQYPAEKLPSRSTVWRNVHKYKTHGTSLNRNKGNSGRKISVRTDEQIEEIRELLIVSPKVVSRRNGVGISKTTFNKITKYDLKFHPYRIHRRHGLRPTDFPRRERFLTNLIISDEARFAMNGKVNTQNVRHYAPKGEVPDFHYDLNESREKLTVLAGLCGNGLVIGPFFIDGNLNRQKHHDMIVGEVFPVLVEHFNAQMQDEHFERLWWAQHGAPAHHADIVQDLLQEIFPGRVIMCDGDNDWPARSPDLTPCDYFLWGYIKSKIFTSPPRSLAFLRQRIVDEFNSLKQNNRLMVRKAMRDMMRRAALCIDRNGQHVEGKI